jgi:hypothetical protein
MSFAPKERSVGECGDRVCLTADAGRFQHSPSHKGGRGYRLVASTTTHHLFLSFHLVPVYLISENFVSAISPQLNTLRPSGPCLPLFSFIPPFSQVNHSDAPRSPLHATIPFVSRSLHQPSKLHPRPPLTSVLHVCLSRLRTYRFSFVRHFWYLYNTHLDLDLLLISLLVPHRSPWLSRSSSPYLICFPFRYLRFLCFSDPGLLVCLLMGS